MFYVYLLYCNLPYVFLHKQYTFLCLCIIRLLLKVFTNVRLQGEK